MTRDDRLIAAGLFAVTLAVVVVLMFWDTTLNPYSEASKTFSKSDELQAKAAEDIRRSACLREKGAGIRLLAEEELERPGIRSLEEMQRETARLEAEYEACAK